MPKPCVFFDRDGIANLAPPPEEYYVLSLDRFFIVPEFLEALKIVEAKGFEAVIATNQKCVARGLITMGELEKIHAHLRKVVADAGAKLLDIYVCPHNDGHPDRKPNPGMLLRAAKDHDLDLASSWMVGDSERDMKAGRAAGCAINVLVREGQDETIADHHLRSMKELPWFLSHNLPQA